MIVNETRKILNAFNAYPKKGYGQNFLITPGVIERIIQTAMIQEDDCVIEIGAGIGALTEALCIKSKKVLCYEIDDVMIRILKETLKKYNNKEIIHGDILKQDINKDIVDNFGDNIRIKVVANLPYYITTPIMFKLLEIDCITSLTIMVQKEMGDRFTSLPNKKDYNALSVYMKYFTLAKQAFVVGKNNFFPVPDVDSVILHIEKDKKDLGINNEANFLKFVRISFSQRRKTLVNNLAVGYELNKRNIEEWLEKLGYKKQIRSEVLALEDFAKIYKYMFEENKND